MSKKTRSKKHKKTQQRGRRLRLQRRQHSKHENNNRILAKRLSRFSDSPYFDHSYEIVESLLNYWQESEKPLHIIAGLIYLAYYYLANCPTSPFTYETFKSSKMGTKSLIELIENSGGQPLLNHLHTLVEKYHEPDYFGSALIYGINQYLNLNSATYISTPTPIAYLAYKLLNIHSTDKILDCGIGAGNFFLTVVTEHGYHSRTHYYGYEISLPMATVAAARLTALNIDCTYSDDDVISALANQPEEKFNKIFADISFNTPIDPETAQLVNKPYLENLRTYDWFIIDTICDHLTENGRGVAVISDYYLSSPEFADIRKHYLEQGLVESVITFDNQAFGANRSNSVSLLVLSHNNNRVKFINANFDPSMPSQPPALDLPSTLGVKLSKFQKHHYSLDANVYRPDSHQYTPVNESLSHEDYEFSSPKIHTKKIIIIGQKAGHKTASLTHGAELIGISADSLELHLEYEDGKNMDFEKYRDNPDYAAILLGPMPHKGKGIGKYNSVADMLQHEPGFPDVVWLDKLSVHAMQDAIRRLLADGILTTDRAGLIQ